MELQTNVSPVNPEDFARVVDVWEASVRATHSFVSEADINTFRPLVRDSLPTIPQLACVRDVHGAVAGFIAVVDGKVEALFLHPDARRQGAGRQLLIHAINTFGATTLDVNEQNPEATAFYKAMGFEVVGRSELDGMGKPYPLLHMRLRAS